MSIEATMTDDARVDELVEEWTYGDALLTRSYKVIMMVRTILERAPKAFPLVRKGLLDELHVALGVYVSSNRDLIAAQYRSREGSIPLSFITAQQQRATPIADRYSQYAFASIAPLRQAVDDATWALEYRVCQGMFTLNLLEFTDHAKFHRIEGWRDGGTEVPPR